MRNQNGAKSKWEAEFEWETTDAACNSYSSLWTYFIPFPLGTLACPFLLLCLLSSVWPDRLTLGLTDGISSLAWNRWSATIKKCIPFPSILNFKPTSSDLSYASGSSSSTCTALAFHQPSRTGLGQELNTGRKQANCFAQALCFRSQSRIFQP